jgi:hypothetical protein
VSAHDLAVALDIETDLVTPVPRRAFEDGRNALARYLAERLVITAQGAPCAMAGPALDLSALPADLIIGLRYDCPAPVMRLGVRYGLFFDLDPGHRSLGKVVLGGRREAFVFDRSFRQLDLDVGAARGGTARVARMVWLGAEHIVLGYDHLLFLLVLLLGASRLGDVVRIVSAFTLAHSLTLALAWFGIVALPARLVEAAIAASIAYVAVENVVGRAAARRWVLAGGFGLVHGLGFYGALRDLGLEGADVVSTLLAFNLGVEIAQIALVTMAWVPLTWWTRRHWYPMTARACSAAVLLFAVWLVLQRARAG